MQDPFSHLQPDRLLPDLQRISESCHRVSKGSVYLSTGRPSQSYLPGSRRFREKGQQHKSAHGDDYGNGDKENTKRPNTLNTRLDEFDLLVEVHVE